MEKEKTNQKNNGITKEYKIKLENDLKHLIDIERPEIIKQIQEAREQGDLSENADYDSARNRQAEIEARINEINVILENSFVIEVPLGNIDKVSLMTFVTIETEDHKQFKYQIVGSKGADPLNGIISSEAPISKALLGHKVGDIVEIKNIEAPYSVKILKISNN